MYSRYSRLPQEDEDEVVIPAPSICTPVQAPPRGLYEINGAAANESSRRIGNTAAGSLPGFPRDHSQTPTHLNESTLEDENDCLEEDARSHDHPSSGPSRAHKNPREKRRAFILFPRRLRSTTEKRSRRSQAFRQRASDQLPDLYDYDQKYPSDEQDMAMEPNARFWRVYLDEAGQFDSNMAENFKDTVDVILVFAGLFSAVTTTLVTETSSALRRDYAQVCASLLVELIAIQRAVGSDGSPTIVPASLLNLTSPLEVSVTDRSVNGLWFTSLAFSLSTALIAVLIKQWIQAYLSPISGTPQYQARVRHFRYLGIERWHVPIMVGLLPILLHLSLLLFFLGLIVHLFSLDRGIAMVSLAITMLAYTVYSVTTLLPIVYPQCPYKTPIADYMHHLSRLSMDAFRHNWTTVRRTFSRGCSNSIRPSNKSVPSLREMEVTAIQKHQDEVDAEMLTWLFSTSSNPSVQSIVVDTVCDLRLGFTFKSVLRHGILDFVCKSIHACFTPSSRSQQVVRPGAEAQLSRLLRAHLQLVTVSDAANNVQCSHLAVEGQCCLAVETIIHTPNPTSSLDSLRYTYLHPNASRWPALNVPRTPLVPSLQDLAQLQPPYSPKHVWICILRRAVQAAQLQPGFDPKEWPACASLLNLMSSNLPTNAFEWLEQILLAAFLSHHTKRRGQIVRDPELLEALLHQEQDYDSLVLHSSVELEAARRDYCTQFLSHVAARFAGQPRQIKLDWMMQFLALDLFEVVHTGTDVSFLPLPPELLQHLSSWFPARDLVEHIMTHRGESSNVTADSLSRLLAICQVLLPADPRSLEAFEAGDPVSTLDAVYQNLDHLEPSSQRHVMEQIEGIMRQYLVIIHARQAMDEKHATSVEYLLQHLKSLCAWAASMMSLGVTHGFIFTLAEWYATDLRWQVALESLEDASAPHGGRVDSDNHLFQVSLTRRLHNARNSRYNQRFSLRRKPAGRAQLTANVKPKATYIDVDAEEAAPDRLPAVLQPVTPVQTSFESQHYFKEPGRSRGWVLHHAV